MNRPITKSTIAVLASLAALIAAASPAAALTFKGDGFYARFGPSMATDVRGLVIADRLGGDNPRLSVGLSGLIASDEFFVIGRSIGCNGTPSQANRVFRVTGMADANGGSSFTRSLSPGDIYGGIKSIWVNWGDGAVCQFSINFSRIDFVVGDWDGDGALSLTKVGAGTLILLVEKRPNARARLSLNGTGIAGTGALRIRGVDRACGTPPTSTSFTVTFQDVLVSSFRTKVIDLTQDQLDALRSVRVNRLSGGNTWCGPVSIIAVLIA